MLSEAGASGKNRGFGLVSDHQGGAIPSNYGRHQRNQATERNGAVILIDPWTGQWILRTERAVSGLDADGAREP